mmetsp:Transcript_44128/g.86574  ORF Transcript_44128/g.86574 Transcript_44128/m.86574 type:complete len:287 (+) Transcript_44128:376-1236(+)
MSVVSVLAPVDLPPGYELEVMVENRIYSVEVPQEGIKAGGGAVLAPFSRRRFVDLPSKATIGQWKDRFCDCCKYGCCTAVFCNTIFCPQILMAQIMTRMKLNWCGTSVPMEVTSTVFRTVILAMVLVSVLTVCERFMFPESSVISDTFSIDIYELTGTEEGSIVGDIFYFASSLPYVIFGIYYLIVLAKTRSFVRKRYSIPNKCPCQDHCCSLMCSCCVLSQMARHTADYTSTKSHFFTRTGLPKDTLLDPLVLISPDPRTLPKLPNLPQEVTNATREKFIPIVVV